MKLFLVLNRISHSFVLLTREISWSILETDFIFPHIPCIILYFLINLQQIIQSNRIIMILNS